MYEYDSKWHNFFPDKVSNNDAEGEAKSMDLQYQPNTLALNPLPTQYTDVNYNHGDDEPVPVTLVLRIRPIPNLSNAVNGTESDRCLFANVAPEILSNVQYDKNSCNSILYRDSKPTNNQGYNAGDEGSPSYVGKPQTEWSFPNGLVFSESSTQEDIFCQIAQYHTWA